MNIILFFFLAAEATLVDSGRIFWSEKFEGPYYTFKDCRCNGNSPDRRNKNNKLKFFTRDGKQCRTETNTIFTSEVSSILIWKYFSRYMDGNYYKSLLEIRVAILMWVWCHRNWRHKSQCTAFRGILNWGETFISSVTCWKKPTYTNFKYLFAGRIFNMLSIIVENYFYVESTHKPLMTSTLSCQLPGRN